MHRCRLPLALPPFLRPRFCCHAAGNAQKSATARQRKAEKDKKLAGAVCVHTARLHSPTCLHTQQTYLPPLPSHGALPCRRQEPAGRQRQGSVHRVPDLPAGGPANFAAPLLDGVWKGPLLSSSLPGSCSQSFMCNMTPAKLKEHSDSRHPKQKFEECFPGQQA